MLGLALVPVALLLAGRAAAQSLPDCTRRCITVNATPGCDINSLKCMCTTASMKTAVPNCINKICGGGGGAAGAIDAWNTRCAALVDNPDTTVPPPPSSNTPKPTPSPQDPPSTRTPNPPSSTETPPAHSTVPDEQTPSPDTTGPNASGTSSPSLSSSSPSSDPTSPIEVTSPNDNSNNGKSGGGGAPSSGGLIGAIVGGLLGGLLVVGIIGCFLWQRRRQERDHVQAYGVSAMSSTSGLSGPMRTSSTHKHSDSLQSGAQAQPHLYRDDGSPDQEVPASIPDTLAPRPLVLDTARASFPRRKGDPPPPPSFRGPASPETEIASESASYNYRDEVSPQGSAPPMAFPAGLTPVQLDLVQTMINRGLQGTAVVDVIERMLAENSTPAPQYDDDSSRART